MNTAYYITGEWGDVRVCEFSYEKRTAKLYTGCKKGRMVLGDYVYLSRRAPVDRVEESRAAALEKARRLLTECVEGARRNLEDALSRLAQVQSLIKKTEAA